LGNSSLDKVPILAYTGTKIGKRRAEMVRKYTNMVLEMVEEGILDKDVVIMACLKYMSEAEVRDMAEANGFVPEDEEEEIRSDYEANRTYERVRVVAGQ